MSVSTPDDHTTGNDGPADGDDFLEDGCFFARDRSRAFVDRTAGDCAARHTAEEKFGGHSGRDQCGAAGQCWRRIAPDGRKCWQLTLHRKPRSGLLDSAGRAESVFKAGLDAACGADHRGSSMLQIRADGHSISGIERKVRHRCQPFD